MTVTRTPAPMRQAAGASLADILTTTLSRALALLLTLAVAWAVYELPVARPYVGAALLICFAAQIYYPGAWLLFVPALLPVFDLTLWSGRIYLTEFDLLVLTAAAAHFWIAPAGWQFPDLWSKRRGIILMLLLSFLASMAIGALPLPPLDANAFANYYSHFNALRVAKGMVWAVLLLGSLQWRLSVDAARTTTLFLVGTSVGLILVGTVVLWERGAIAAIVASPNIWAGRYAIAQAVLDFATAYRATALFSELHTGGEAFDTYSALAPPLAAAGAIALRRPMPRLICLAGLGLGTYAVAASFSRGAYIGFLGGMATVFFLAIRGTRVGFGGKLAGLRIGAAFLLTLGALMVAFSLGGYVALAAGLMMSGTGLVVVHFVGIRSRALAALGIVVLILGGAFVLRHAFIDSKYSHTDDSTALLAAAACALAIGAAALPLGGRTIPPQLRTAAAFVFAAFVVFCGIGIPALGGYRMIERFGGASSDAHERTDHWAEALRLMGGDEMNYVLGMGLGTFPALEATKGHPTEPLSGYRIGRDATRSYVEFLGGDSNLTQKIVMRPHTQYHLSFVERVAKTGDSTVVKLCPKFILISDRYTPDCIEFDYRPAQAGTWITHQESFDSGKLGSQWPAYWPTTLMLSTGEVPVRFSDVHITDGERDIVANGDFADGIDHWIQISDFDHLNWHIKDIYFEVLFENGIVGLAILLVALAMAMINACRAAAQRDPMGIAAGGLFVGFLLVGVVASMFDNPRPAFVFFIVLLWMLQPPSAPSMPLEKGA